MGEPTSNFILTEEGILRVYGITPSCVPYEVEIVGQKAALAWARMLGYSKFNRSSMGPLSAHPTPKRLAKAIAWRIPKG